MIDRERVMKGLEAERRLYAERNPQSQRAAAEATHLFGGVPMTWMAKTAGGFPLFLDRASGARVTTIDGHELVDFCLGDTGAMAGHSPPATVAAVQARYGEAGGATTMMPTEDAAAVAAELTRRFGVSAVELRPHRHRRQPLGPAALPGAHRPPKDPGERLVLPRQRRRVAHRDLAVRPGGPPRQRRRPLRRDREQPGRRVQRPRRAWRPSWPTATSPSC